MLGFFLIPWIHKCHHHFHEYVVYLLGPYRWLERKLFCDTQCKIRWYSVKFGIRFCRERELRLERWGIRARQHLSRTLNTAYRLDPWKVLMQEETP